MNGVILPLRNEMGFCFWSPCTLMKNVLAVNSYFYEVESGSLIVGTRGATTEDSRIHCFEHTRVRRAIGFRSGMGQSPVKGTTNPNLGSCGTNSKRLQMGLMEQRHVPDEKEWAFRDG